MRTLTRRLAICALLIAGCRGLDSQTAPEQPPAAESEHKGMSKLGILALIAANVAAAFAIQEIRHH
jgi:hypothetical protein